MSKVIKGGKILLELDDGNTIELYTAKTKKAKTATDNLSRSESTLNRNFKGASQQSSNTTKNFSKMAQGITGGLVPAYATLAANIFAIGAAFRFLQDAANYRILIEGQREYATVTGESLKLLTSRLQAATGQQLAFNDAAQSVAIARAAGLSSDQISRLGAVAKNASIALGRDLTDSLNRLVRGATKAEPELLDELGIILRLETATKRYAQQLNKTKEDLTIFEKSQAVVNEVLRQGEEKFGEFSTELNEFTRLAKSFDDLVNKIKISLTGIAEFIAKGLTKNVVAAGGAFALLGSGILRAITPEATIPDVGKGLGESRAGIQGMLSKKGMEKFGKLESTKDVADFETAMKRKKSSFLNYAKFTENRAKQMSATLKAYYLQLEIDAGNSFTRMKGRWKLELLSMEMEYGKFIGKIKFAGLMMSRFITALGWAGLAISLVSVLSGLFDKFKDKAASDFEKQMKDVTKALKEQNEVVEELNKNLKKQKTFMAGIVQQAKFMGNFSFAGVEAFGQEAIDVGKFGFTVTKEEIQLIKDVTKSLELQRDQVVEGTKEYDQLTQMINRFNTANIELNRGGGRLDKTLFQQISDDMKNLSKNGTLATQSIEQFGMVVQTVTTAAEQFGNAMSQMSDKGTAFFKMAQSIDILGKALTEIGETDVTQIFKKFNIESYSEALDAATLATVGAMIGEDKLQAILSQRQSNIDANIAQMEAQLNTLGNRTDPKATQQAAGLMTQIQNLRNLPGLSDQEVIKKIGEALTLEASELYQSEIKFLTERLNLQTEFEAKKRGVAKIFQTELAHQQKVRDIELQIAHIEEKRDILKDKGEEKNKVAIAAEEAKLGRLREQLITAKRVENFALRSIDQLNNALATSMQSAIQGLIDGTMNLKEAFTSMTQAVLQQMAQILAQQAAMRLLSFMGLPTGGAMGREGGIMKSPGYRSFSDGGISRGPSSGYTATLHGTEAVVPLPNGRSIPVEMTGGSQDTNNITINVDASGSSTQTIDGRGGEALGKAIQAAVMETLSREKRPGGILSR